MVWACKFTAFLRLFFLNIHTGIAHQTATYQIAHCNDRKPQEGASQLRSPAKGTGTNSLNDVESEIVHVGNTVLKTAQDKAHDRQNHDKWVITAFVTFHSDKHEHAAKNTKNQETEKIVGVLDCHQGARRNGQAGGSHGGCTEGGANQVSQPHLAQVLQVGQIPVRGQVAHLAGKQVKFQKDDGVQSQGKEECTRNFIFYGKEADATYANHETC